MGRLHGLREKQPAVSVDANTRRSPRPSLFPWPHGSLTVG
jgi:hypothetical protein